VQGQQKKFSVVHSNVQIVTAWPFLSFLFLTKRQIWQMGQHLWDTTKSLDRWGLKTTLKRNKTVIRTKKMEIYRTADKNGGVFAPEW